MRVRKAVIPAAGYGTRFLPITKGVPKEMLAVVDKPAIQLVVEEAVDAGITDICIVVSGNKRAIRDYFGKSEIYDSLKNRGSLKSVDDILEKANIEFVLQESMRGNGDAVLVAKKFADGEPIAVLFGDDVIFNERRPAIAQLIEAYEATGKTIIGVQRCEPEIAARCGVICPGETRGRLTEALDMREKPPIDDLPSDLVSLGRFVLGPEIFGDLENAAPFRGEIYLTEAIRTALARDGGYAFEFEGVRYDLGNKLGFCKANVEYGLRSEFGREFAAYLREIAKGLGD